MLALYIYIHTHCLSLRIDLVLSLALLYFAQAKVSTVVDELDSSELESTLKEKAYRLAGAWEHGKP